MKRQDFIEAVYDSGWRSTADAQHKNIGLLWEKLFPTAAAMEREFDNYRGMGRDDCVREVEQLCAALDNGGNEYPRPANATHVLQVLRDKFYT